LAHEPLSRAPDDRARTRSRLVCPLANRPAFYAGRPHPRRADQAPRHRYHSHRHKGAAALDPRPRRGAGPISLCDQRHRNERPTAAVGCSSRNRRAGYGGETADITLEDAGYSLPPSAFRVHVIAPTLRRLRASQPVDDFRGKSLAPRERDYRNVVLSAPSLRSSTGFGKPQDVQGRNYDACDRQLSRNAVPTEYLAHHGRPAVPGARDVEIFKLASFALHRSSPRVALRHQRHD